MILKNVTNNEEADWFKCLIYKLIDEYTIYLEYLGMEKFGSHMLVKEPGKGGGAFYIHPQVAIHAPSVNDSYIRSS
jgi:hypothetical protein